MNSQFTRLFLVLSVLSFTAGTSAQILIETVDGEAQASASASDYRSGESQDDNYYESVDDLNLLPIGGSVYAHTDFAGASGSSALFGELVDPFGYLSVNAGGSGDAYADEFNGDASGDGWADIYVDFQVLTPMVARLDLGCAGKGSGYAAGAVYVGNTFITGVELWGKEYLEMEYLFVPGITYQIYCAGGGGGSGDDQSGMASWGDASVGVTPLCGYQGVLQLGNNPIDTNATVGSNLDLDGICDHGPFGNDTLYNVAYYTFTPYVTGIYTFSTCNQAEFDTRIAVLEMGCAPETTLDCLDDTEGCGGYTTRLDMYMEAGTTYTVAVGGYSKSEFGLGILTVSPEGDLNGDGIVNGADLGLLIGAWGTDGPGDFNKDGVVDAADLGLLLAFWSL